MFGQEKKAMAATTELTHTATFVTARYGNCPMPSSHLTYNLPDTRVPQPMFPLTFLMQGS